MLTLISLSWSQTQTEASACVYHHSSSVFSQAALTWVILDNIRSASGLNCGTDHICYTDMALHLIVTLMILIFIPVSPSSHTALCPLVKCPADMYV